MGCIFCKIVSKQEPAHVIWEDIDHIAFLSIFPNTVGVSVVIPKIHFPSYNFALPDSVLMNLVLASKKVATLLDNAFDCRTGLVMEGFGIDHVHTKLFPLHGTSNKKWSPIRSEKREFFEYYQGYISSHDGSREDDTKLSKIATYIKDKNSCQHF